ncbi:MAG: glycosyltransferase involved in cell wall biosynthesis [Woeseiaceae bacterium]|jgi:glycosyltransferase involved in cell wall biosynthesis
MSIRIRLLQTIYPHWGAHTGIHQFVQHLDKQQFRTDTRRHADGNSDRQWPNGNKWYGRSDFAAEMKSIPGCMFNSTQILHYLDGEHTVHYLPAWLRKFRFSRARTVATFHQPARMLEKLVNPEVIENLHHVNLVSPCQLDFFRQFLPADRITVILHGIDTAFFKPAPRVRSTDVFRVVTVGHWLRDWTAIDKVAMKLRDEADVEFHVVTNRDTQMQASKNVTYHRNISDQGLRSLYQQCDVLFLPLTHSTANNSILEGIACGLPVISTSMESVNTYLPNNEALLFEDNPPDQLADAILYLKDRPEIRAKMGRQARQRAEELSWQNIAREFESLYTGLQAAR